MWRYLLNIYGTMKEVSYVSSLIHRYSVQDIQ
jgi:hypothetical protein